MLTLLHYNIQHNSPGGSGGGQQLGRIGFLEQQQLQLHQHNATPLPDSPPDSGSEPYSPQEDSPHSFIDHPIKASLAGSMPSLPQPLYQGPPHSRLPPPPDLGLGHKMPPAYIGGPEPPKLNHMSQGHHGGGGMGVGVAGGPPGLPSQMGPGMNPPHAYLPHHFGSISNLSNQPSKKRRLSDSPPGTLTSAVLPHHISGMLGIKQEPHGLVTAMSQYPQYMGDCSNDDDFAYDLDPGMGFVDGYQVIKWQNFNAPGWNPLTDANFKDLPLPTYRVDADKGFNFSVPDESFVCQKKNHFQVTVHVGLQGIAKYVRTEQGVKKIDDFFVHFHGVKMESPTQLIKIEQSQSDRSKKPFHPVKVDLLQDQVMKLTVGRLHFSETTSNNMRKKGKPNPDQRYFKLVVALQAQSGQGNYLICAHSSERIIVRASNPGQFDNEVDVMWQKGHTGEAVYHVGKVGVNTDHPEEALSVHGNVRVTGHVLQPSDRRVKENIEEVDPKNQLETVSRINIYRYQYQEDFAEDAGIPLDRRQDTGVLAQEMLDVLPDAVQNTGDVRLPNGTMVENFLVVNKDRIFMENVGAVKELCKLTDNLEVRIDELEKMNKRLASLKRYGSIKSTHSYNSTCSSLSTLSSCTTTGPPSKKPHNVHIHIDKRSTTTTTTATTAAPKSKDTDKGNSNSSSSSNSCSHKGCGSSRSHHSSRGCQHHRSSHHRRSSSISSLSSFSHMHKMCGNRFLQIIVFILVLVMAFCLVAITALYILELHKPKGDDASVPKLALTAPVFTTTHSPRTSSPAGSSNRSIPVVIHGGLSLHNTTPTTPHTPSPLPPSFPSSVPAPSVTAHKQTSKATTETTPQPLNPPTLRAYPPCELSSKESCEQMCCPLNIGEDDPWGPPYHVITGGSDGESSLVNHVLGGGTSHPGGDTPPPEQQNTGMFVSPTDDRNNRIQVVINGGNGPSYNVVGNHKLPHYIYKREATTTVSDLTIVVKELNATIDHNCISGCSGNNRTYYVPLAPLFGFEPITLQYKMNRTRHVALCRTNPEAVCGEVGDNPSYHPPAPQASNGTLVEWQLRVGVNAKTTYFFRVAEGHGIPDDNVSEFCTLTPTQGLMILDLKLEFHRTCPP